MVWVVERGYEYEGGIPVAAFTSAAEAAEYIRGEDPEARADATGRRWVNPEEGRVWALYPVPLDGGVAP